ncbi:MAG: hypothetical protein ACJ74Z_09315 [Bryobacteraceae bacterium]
MPECRITGDISQLKTDLKELESLLVESPDVSEEIINRLLSLLNKGFKISSNVESLPTNGTTDIRLTFQLSDALREFATTLRARKNGINVI